MITWPPAHPPRLLAIVGPTASGKSDVALRLARRFAGEIVAADSMQVYRQMDAGTAKPSPAERRLVPHHMIDLADPGDAFNVAKYQLQAMKVIREIGERGGLPILVGGTGLYIKSVIDNYAFVPSPETVALREELRREAGAHGTPALHAWLARVDPAAAATIDPHDARRTVRALEVALTTGRPISEAVTATAARAAAAGPAYDLLMYGLAWERNALYARVERRVDAMLAAGWLDEVKRLLSQGQGLSGVAMQALGYRELAAHVAGRLSLAEATALIKRNTRRFAKRQLTWFRPDARIRWIALAREADLDRAVATIANGIEEKWWPLYNGDADGKKGFPTGGRAEHEQTPG